MAYPLVSVADYTLVDDIGRRFALIFEETPYWVFIAVAVLLFVLFLYGLAKRLVVFTVLVAVVNGHRRGLAGVRPRRRGLGRNPQFAGRNHDPR